MNQVGKIRVPTGAGCPFVLLVPGRGLQIDGADVEEPTELCP